VAEDRQDDIMAIGERVGLDHDTVADDTLDREAPTVDDRGDSLDDGASPSVGRWVGQHHVRSP